MSASADPLRSLHKMSTTAGVGSQEYVAINLAAVWAVVLGLLSFLALLDNVLLIVPVIGTLFAIVALRQISQSAGTQAGRGIAAIALLLCVGFGGFTLAGQVHETREDRADRAAIAAQIEQLGRDVKDGKWESAYGRFSQEFRARVPQQKFADELGFLRKSQLYGDLTSTSWNEHVRFEGAAGGEVRFAETVMLIRWDKSPDPLRLNTVLRRRGGQWYLEGLEGMFQPEKSAKGPAGG
jgi:hypothetical protein